MPFTKPKNVTQENLKAPKQPSAGKDFTASQHYFYSFPFSERFCTPFSVPLCLSRNPNHSNILVCTNTSAEAGAEKQIFVLWCILWDTDERAQLLFPAPLWGAQHVLPCPPCSGTFGISDSAFFPSHCPSSCHLLPHWKSRIWPVGKIHLDFSFPLPMARGNFVFLGHLSISLMN